MLDAKNQSKKSGKDYGSLARTDQSADPGSTWSRNLVEEWKVNRTLTLDLSFNIEQSKPSLDLFRPGKSNIIRAIPPRKRSVIG